MVAYAVGTVPPSMTTSAPVIAPASGDARKAIRLATSCGFAGRPSGMPPSALITIRLPPSTSVPACSAADTHSADLAKDADSLDGLSRESLLKSALVLYDGDACPVCDTPFGPDAFEAHLAGKLTHLDEVSKRRVALEAELKPILDSLHTTGSALTTMIDHAALFSPKIDAAALVDYRATLRGW